MRVGPPRKPPRGEGWAQRRFDVLRRDRFRCQDCGAKRRKASPKGRIAAVVLHVHHKKPFRCFKSDRQANRMSNLITLCGPCHAKAERLARANKAFVTHPEFVAPAPFHGASWSAARKAVLIRDGYKCQTPSCFRHYSKATAGLHVHHKVPSVVLQHLHYDGTQASLDKAQALANQPENLITLCAACHREVEQESKTAYPRLHDTSRLSVEVRSVWGDIINACQQLRRYLYSKKHGGCFIEKYDLEIETAANELFTRSCQERKDKETALVAKKYPGAFCCVDISALAAYRAKEAVYPREMMDAHGFAPLWGYLPLAPGGGWVSQLPDNYPIPESLRPAALPANAT